MAGEIISQVVQSVEPTAEENAAALAAAAAVAPTTEEEARAQNAAADAAKAAAATRPEGLPEKFKSWEDMAASYAALEAKLGAPADEAAGDSEAAEGDAEGEAEGEETPDLGEGLSFEELDAEWQEKGELSEESYKALEAQGFDKARVDQYIAGQEALAQIATQRITDAAGGKDQLEATLVWAKTALSAAEIEAFNSTMETGDVTAAVLAAEKLKGRYEASNGVDGKLLNGKAGGAALDTYSSWADVTIAMSDPLYQTSPDYRAKVEAKLGRSNPA